MLVVSDSLTYQAGMADAVTGVNLWRPICAQFRTTHCLDIVRRKSLVIIPVQNKIIPTGEFIVEYSKTEIVQTWWPTAIMIPGRTTRQIALSTIRRTQLDAGYLQINVDHDGPAANDNDPA